MVSTLGGSYATGTARLKANATSVEGIGTLWSAVAEQGDWFYANGFIGLIDTVIDDANIVLADPWPGHDLGGHALNLRDGLSYLLLRDGVSRLLLHGHGADYRILKMSWLRYDPALTQSKVRDFIKAIQAAGLYLFVAGEAPDPSLGEEGQWALKTNDASGKLWHRVGGVWVLQGSFAGFAWKRSWSSATAYVTNDVVARLGKAWVARHANTDKPPESNPDDWDEFVGNGDRYDISIDASDRPESGERIAKVVFTTGVVFPAGLAASRAHADVAATANAVFALRKNGVQFGTATFAAGATTATFASAADTTFAPGDVLVIDAPDPRDATLSELAFMLTGFRS